MNTFIDDSKYYDHLVQNRCDPIIEMEEWKTLLEKEEDTCYQYFRRFPQYFQKALSSSSLKLFIKVTSSPGSHEYVINCRARGNVNNLSTFVHDLILKPLPKQSCVYT